MYPTNDKTHAVAQRLPSRHPNIAAAQRLTQQAYEKLVSAQQANEWDMEGHAQKAKNLLDEVNRELKIAAAAAARRCPPECEPPR